MCYTNGDDEFSKQLKNTTVDELLKTMSRLRVLPKPIDVIVTTDNIYNKLMKEMDRHSEMYERPYTQYVHGLDPPQSIKMYGIPVKHYPTIEIVRDKAFRLSHNGMKVKLFIEEEDE